MPRQRYRRERCCLTLVFLFVCFPRGKRSIPIAVTVELLLAVAALPERTLLGDASLLRHLGTCYDSVCHRARRHMAVDWVVDRFGSPTGSRTTERHHR